MSSVFNRQGGLIVLLLLLIQISGHTQTRNLTIGDATNMNPKLNPKNLGQLKWIPGTRDFRYVRGNYLVLGSPDRQKSDTILTLHDVNLALTLLKADTMKRFPAMISQNEKGFSFVAVNRLVSFDIKEKSAVILNTWNEKAENLDIDPTGAAAYTIDNNLFIAVDGKEIRVSNEQNPAILFGSSRVHRNEFGIEKGTFWSPDGKTLAFYRMDETGVADYPLVDTEQPIAKVKPVKYPMAGMTSHKVTLGVMNLATGRIVYMQTDTTMNGAGSDRIEYLTNITWSPDGTSIYIATLNRDQNHMQLNNYDPSSGRLIRTLFEEKDTKYVEPQNGPAFINNDPARFIWLSRRDGYNHLYLYKNDGSQIKQLTSGPWEVSRLIKADASGKEFFFMANRENPLNSQLYSTDLKNGDLRLITRTDGSHNTDISDDGRYILDSYSNFNISRQIELLDSRGKCLEILLTNENPLKDYKTGNTSVFTIRNQGNSDLYCRMITPPGFDSTRKYPVIIYVYGGPHSQLITNSWLAGAGLFLNYLATRGFVVFTLDNRGTAGRGREFEQAIFRNLGVAELSDQMAGVARLKSLPYVDTTRIGINGWSYGGFMTLTMMLKNPNTFRVGVCGGPVTDWKFYEVMYGERYMDTPESNPEGYKNASLLNIAGKLTGKLLIIHDDQDETVVPQNSVTFLKQCVNEGKQVDFFLYPGHEHNVHGKDRVHLNTKMVQYFEDFLMPVSN